MQRTKHTAVCVLHSAAPSVRDGVILKFTVSQGGKKIVMWGWRDNLAVKSNDCCSSRGLGFGSNIYMCWPTTTCNPSSNKIQWLLPTLSLIMHTYRGIREEGEKELF
jgi:hypothetical protein